MKNLISDNVYNSLKWDEAEFSQLNDTLKGCTIKYVEPFWPVTDGLDLYLEKPNGELIILSLFSDVGENIFANIPKVRIEDTNENM